MKIADCPFTVIDWKDVEPVAYPGESGSSLWRTVACGNVRTRIVEYSPGYRSDHWCPRGHIFYVLEGEFGISLKDGQEFLLRPGMSFGTGDDETSPHLGYSESGARAFIVD